MPLVKAAQLNELSETELRERIARLRKEQFELNQKKEIGQLDRPHRFGHIRREVAQIMTALGQRKKDKKKS